MGGKLPPSSHPGGWEYGFYSHPEWVGVFSKSCSEKLPPTPTQEGKSTPISHPEWVGVGRNRKISLSDTLLLPPTPGGSLWKSRKSYSHPLPPKAVKSDPNSHPLRVGVLGGKLPPTPFPNGREFPPHSADSPPEWVGVETPSVRCVSYYYFGT